MYFVANFVAATLSVSAYVLDTTWLFGPTCLALGLCVCCTASRARASAQQLCTCFICITRSTQRSVCSAKEWHAWLGLLPSAIKSFLNKACEGIQRSICSISRMAGQKGIGYWRTIRAQTSALWRACASLAVKGSLLSAPSGSWLSSAGYRIWECFAPKALIAKAAAESLRLPQTQKQRSLLGYFCRTQSLHLFQWAAASSRCAGCSAAAQCMWAAYSGYQALLSLQAEGKRLCPGLGILGPATATVALLIWLAPEAAMSVCCVLTWALSLNAMSRTWQASSCTACIATASATAQTALRFWMLASRLGSQASLLGTSSAANSYQALLLLCSHSLGVWPFVGPFMVLIFAVGLAHETQIWQAVLTMCAVLGVTAAISTATGTWNPVTALLETMTATSPAPPSVPALGPASAATAAADEGVCHQHSHGIGASCGRPTAAAPATAQRTALPDNYAQAAHDCRLDPSQV